VLFQTGEKRLLVFIHEQIFQLFRLHKSFSNGMIEKRGERVEIAMDVEQPDRLVKIAELKPREDFE
jgi:hypothetical protein